MAWTHYQYVLALTLVITGSLNTLTTKWADRLKSIGKDNVKRPFDHPFVQAWIMFVGELVCLICFKIICKHYQRKADGSIDTKTLVKGNRDFNPLLFCIPAMCDLLATSTNFIGLNLTYASSMAMLRGGVIVCTGLFTVIFLTRRLSAQEWIGIGFITVGLAVVGLSDFISNDFGSEASYSRNSVITGDVLIMIAQIFQATQVVYEEHFVAGLNIAPLQAVGLEGVFGLFVLSILLVPMYFITVPAPFGVRPDGNLEDFVDAMIQIKNNRQLTVITLFLIFSVATLNFAGVSVTKELSSTTRAVLGPLSTLVIWMSSLALRWQQFQLLQLLGFVIIIFGTCLYHDVIIFHTYDAIRRVFCRNRENETNENVVNQEEASPVIA